MNLSTDQQHAHQTIMHSIMNGQRNSVLTGPAGSGKTTLLKALLRDLDLRQRQVVLAAPTGRAAMRIQELTHWNATTLHAVLYRFVHELPTGELHFGGRKKIADGQPVVFICDEASMVSQTLYADIQARVPRGSSILWVGDADQLPPVDGSWGPSFHAPTARLVQIHRQAEGSPIIPLANNIRLNGVEPPTLGRASIGGAVAYAQQADTDAVLLTYTNRTRRAANEAARATAGRTQLLEPGDRIVCTRTSKRCGLFNGELRDVLTVSENDEYTLSVSWTDGAGIIPKSCLRGEEPPALNWHRSLVQTYGDTVLLAEYGSCLTVHKAQGSQWDHVVLLQDGALRDLHKRDHAFWRRLLYTACTRASKQLTIFNVG